MSPALVRGVKRSAVFAVLVVGFAFGVRPRLLRNVTPSLPYGVYWRTGEDSLRRGDVVTTRVPEHVRELFNRRRYAPRQIETLLKPLAAVAGDWVCITDGRLLINGRDSGQVRAADFKGRALPQAPICRELVGSEGYLATSHGLSFDSRHFGPVDLSALTGPYVPLVTW